MEGGDDFFTGAEEVPAEGAPEQVCFSEAKRADEAVGVLRSCAVLYVLLPHRCFLYCCWCELALHVCQ